jgi:hypothetical protein
MDKMSSKAKYFIQRLPAGVFVSLASFLILFFALQIFQSDDVSYLSIGEFLNHVLRGELQTNIEAQKISILSIIGPSFLAVLLAFSFLVVFSLLISFLPRLYDGFVLKIVVLIHSSLAFLSGFHIIFFSILWLLITGNQDVSRSVIILLAALSSGLYLDITEQTLIFVNKMNQSDYIVAVRALGQSVWKAGRRELLIWCLTLFRSSWLLILSNVIIAEIIFSSGGIGHILRRELLIPAIEGVNVELNAVLAAIFGLIMGIFILNLLIDITLEYLRKWRRN